MTARIAVGDRPGDAVRQTAPLHAAQIAFELPARLRLHRDVAAVVIADLEAGVVQPPDLVPVQEPGSDDRDQRLSLNMKLLGSVDKFFYRDVAGIRPLAPGFRRIAVAPKVTGSLRSAAAEIRTVRGPAAVAWRRERGRLRLSAAIPANAAAEVRLPTPGGQPALVTEGGRPVWRTRPPRG